MRWHRHARHGDERRWHGRGHPRWHCASRRHAGPAPGPADAHRRDRLCWSLSDLWGRHIGGQAVQGDAPGGHRRSHRLGLHWRWHGRRRWLWRLRPCFLARLGLTSARLIWCRVGVLIAGWRRISLPRLTSSEFLAKGLVVLPDQIVRHLAALLRVVSGLFADARLLFRNFHGFKPCVLLVRVVEGHPSLLGHMMQGAGLRDAAGVVHRIRLAVHQVVGEGLSQGAIDHDEVSRLPWRVGVLPLHLHLLAVDHVESRADPLDRVLAALLWVLPQEVPDVLLQQVLLAHRLGGDSTASHEPRRLRAGCHRTLRW
mmetsp:Transcript_21979/g.46736  ORF Transcript_21979/g.46736 Transcript_21979/m.46736 type:complete len:313 (-) Transcript_21979:910-1848(-)